MRSKVDPEKARQQYAAAAFRAYANKRGLNKTWEQLDAESKEAWCEAADEVASAILGTLDQERVPHAELEERDERLFTEDHISQLQTQFVGRGGLPGRVRIIIAPDRISLPFAAPLQGRHDG